MRKTEKINVAILAYATKQMNSNNISFKEYEDLKELVSNIINAYYPLWDCFEEE